MDLCGLNETGVDCGPCGLNEKGVDCRYKCKLWTFWNQVCISSDQRLIHVAVTSVEHEECDADDLFCDQ